MSSLDYRAGRQTGAFTLVEVLVTVAIVGVLAAAITWAGQGAIRGAQRAECLGNLRQIGVALHSLEDDNQGWLPATRHTAQAGEGWIDTIRPYVGDVDRIRICPADPKGPSRLRAQGTSYLLNSEFFVPRRGPFGELLEDAKNFLPRITQPARTILLFTVTDNRGVADTNDHTHSELWSSWGSFLSDVEPDRFRKGERSQSRTEGSANYLYADGRAENHTAESIKKLFQQGRNIALDGQAP